MGPSTLSDTWRAAPFCPHLLKLTGRACIWLLPSDMGCPDTDYDLCQGRRHLPVVSHCWCITLLCASSRGMFFASLCGNRFVCVASSLQSAVLGLSARLLRSGRQYLRLAARHFLRSGRQYLGLAARRVRHSSGVIRARNFLRSCSIHRVRTT